MSRLFVDDELWARVEPMLPRWRPNRRGGQPRKSDRVCLSGIMFVLKTGIPWEDFPQEMGCCGMTLWNRLHEWQQSGVWHKLHRVLLERLEEARPHRFVSQRAGRQLLDTVWNGEMIGPERRSARTRIQGSLRLDRAEQRSDVDGEENQSPRRFSTDPFTAGEPADQRKRVG